MDSPARRSILPSLLLLATVSLAAQAPAGGPSTPAVPTGPVWRVERDSIVGYLVGSIHVLSADYYPLPDAVQRAFEQSATLVGELHPDELTPAAGARMFASALLPSGQTLEQQVPVETWAPLRDRIAKTPLPLAVFERMKPWMAAVTLLTLELQRAGFQPELGVDRHLLDRAVAGGKRVEGLETLDQQIERLDGMSPRLQIELVRETLRDIETQNDNVKALADAWRDGDIPALDRLLMSDLKADPELYQRLIVERNRQWVPTLDTCFAQHAPCLVVVGAAHLLGADSVVVQLRARGYKVERWP